MIILKPARRNGVVAWIDGKALASQYDPVKESARIINSLKPATEVAICLGLGPIYHLEKLCGKLSTVIVIEPRVSRLDEFFILKNHFNHLPFFKKNITAEVFLKGDLDKIEFMLDNLSTPLTFNKIQVFDQLALNHQFYNVIKNNLIKSFDRLQKNLNTENYFASVWKENSVLNLEKMNINLLSSLTINKDEGVLIGSGLGLEREIPWLMNQKNVFKCALPGTLRLLLKHGICPDIVLSTDASYYNSYHFQCLRDLDLEIPIIVPVSISHLCVKHYRGKIFWFFDDYFIVNLLDELCVASLNYKNFIMKIKNNFIPMQGSVTVSALAVFKRLGINRIATLGVDFKTTPFKAHAVANTTEELLFTEVNRLKPFENRYHYLFCYDLKKDNQIKDTWTDKKLAIYKQLFTKELNSQHLNLIPLNQIKGDTKATSINLIEDKLNMLDETRAIWSEFKNRVLNSSANQVPVFSKSTLG